MMLEIILSGLTAAAPAPQSPVDVRQGDTLILDDFQGTVHVEGSEAATMNVTGEDKTPVAFNIERAESTVVLRLGNRENRDRTEALHITVPVWMNVRLSGHRLEAHVTGLSGAAEIRTTEGDIALHQLSGGVNASAIQGEVEANDLSGTAKLRSAQGDIQVRNASGSLETETIQGDMELNRVESSRVTARTTQGDIEFEGRLQGEGVYEFRSHSGDIVLTLTPPLHIGGTVMTYHGDFESDFPIHTTTYRSGEAITFTVGEAHSRIVLEAFDGDVELRLQKSD